MNSFMQRATSSSVKAAVANDYKSVLAAVKGAIHGHDGVASGFRPSWSAEHTGLAVSNSMTLSPSEVKRVAAICQDLVNQGVGTVQLCKITYMEDGDLTPGFDVYAYIEGMDSTGIVVQSCAAMGCVFVMQVSV